MGTVIKTVGGIGWGKAKNYLWVRSMGGLSLVGVTTYLQAHWLKFWPLLHNTHWMDKREVVDDSTNRAATAS